MANIKSAKKQAKQSEVRRIRNLSRKTAIKTAIKKVYQAIEKGLAADAVENLLRDAQAQLSRAKNKNLLHANAAARKTSRLTKYVARRENAK